MIELLTQKYKNSTNKTIKSEAGKSSWTKPSAPLPPTIWRKMPPASPNSRPPRKNSDSRPYGNANLPRLRYWAPLKIGFRQLFASGQSPTGKIFGGYLQVATLKSSCIGLFAHTLKIHPIEFLEFPYCHCGRKPVPLPSSARTVRNHVQRRFSLYQAIAALMPRSKFQSGS